jgi:hypothetical protein
MTTTGSVRLIFSGEVLAEGALRACAIFCNAARADLARSISDDPYGALAESAVGISFFGAQPDTGPLGWTRHSSLIFWIAESVV